MGVATRWMLRGERAIDLAAPRLVGVLNLTPDSFHAASRVLDGESVLAAARAMQEAGADMLDLGAESTRPGAARVPPEEQIRRLEVVVGPLQAKASGLGVPWSVDTTSAAVARHALEHGADAINDVSAGLEDPGMLPLAAEAGCGLVLMHRALPPDTDSYSDRYAAPPMAGDVVAAVAAFLRDRARAAVDAGVRPERICLDPGFGFGKTVEQNVALARGIGEILDLGFPVLAGVSRKSFIGRIGTPDRDTTPQERLPATLGAGLALVERGVRLLRVHDVAEHAAAIRAWDDLRGPA